MIAEKILGKLTETAKHIDLVEIDWFERDKRILRKTTADGEEIGITTDTPLNENDILFEDDRRVIAVTIAPCDLISVPVFSMREMGRLCFELGNRHLSIAIGDSKVKCPFDPPTFEYLIKLGFKAEKTHEKFTGYSECRGHAHSHSHENHGHTHDHHDCNKHK